MYGSAFRLKPKAGKAAAITALVQERERDRGAMKGFRFSIALEDASGDIFVTVAFDDEQSYRANASDPEQDKWYRRLRDMLEADPEWHDGKVLDFQSR